MAKVHVELASISRLLEQEIHYAEAGVDPAEAFEALYYGWKHAEQRRSGRKVTYFDLMWRRGWLTESDALRLCDYCITGWKPAFE